MRTHLFLAVLTTCLSYLHAGSLAVLALPTTNANNASLSIPSSANLTNINVTSAVQWFKKRAGPIARTAVGLVIADQLKKRVIVPVLEARALTRYNDRLHFFQAYGREYTSDGRSYTLRIIRKGRTQRLRIQEYKNGDAFVDLLEEYLAALPDDDMKRKARVLFQMYREKTWDVFLRLDLEVLLTASGFQWDDHVEVLLDNIERYYIAPPYANRGLNVEASPLARYLARYEAVKHGRTFENGEGYGTSAVRPVADDPWSPKYYTVADEMMRNLEAYIDALPPDAPRRAQAESARLTFQLCREETRLNEYKHGHAAMTNLRVDAPSRYKSYFGTLEIPGGPGMEMAYATPAPRGNATEYVFHWPSSQDIRTFDENPAHPFYNTSAATTAAIVFARRSLLQSQPTNVVTTLPGNVSLHVNDLTRLLEDAIHPEVRLARDAKDTLMTFAATDPWGYCRLFREPGLLAPPNFTVGEECDTQSFAYHVLHAALIGCPNAEEAQRRGERVLSEAESETSFAHEEELRAIVATMRFDA